MTQRSLDPFERAFQPSDVATFAELVQGISGQRISRWRETYAQGIVIDCGELVPKSSSIPRAVADRGEWVISTWGCDILFRERPETPLVSSFEQLKAFLAGLVGHPLVQISIASEDLSLTAVFAGGAAIVLQTDRDDPGLDQWFITTPAGDSIGVSASGKWYLRSQE